MSRRSRKSTAPSCQRPRRTKVSCLSIHIYTPTRRELLSLISAREKNRSDLPPEMGEGSRVFRQLTENIGERLILPITCRYRKSPYNLRDSERRTPRVCAIEFINYLSLLSPETLGYDRPIQPFIIIHKFVM